MTQAQLRSVLHANWARTPPEVRGYSRSLSNVPRHYNCSQQACTDPMGWNSESNRRERSAVAEVAWLSLR